MKGRKNNFQVTGVINSRGVRVWGMESTNSFLDLWNLMVLGIIKVKIYRKQLVTLIWSSREG